MGVTPAAQVALAVIPTAVPAVTLVALALKEVAAHVPGAETTTDVVASVSGTLPGTALAQTIRLYAPEASPAVLKPTLDLSTASGSPM